MEAFTVSSSRSGLDRKLGMASSRTRSPVDGGLMNTDTISIARSIADVLPVSMTIDREGEPLLSKRIADKNQGEQLIKFMFVD